MVVPISSITGSRAWQGSSGRVDPHVGDRTGHVHAPGGDLVQGVVVRDDVVLTALVQALVAGRLCAVDAQVRAAAVEHAEHLVGNLRHHDGHRVGLAVVLGVVPAEQHVVGLAGADVDGELLVGEVLVAGAYDRLAVTAHHSAVVAVGVERVGLGADVQVPGHAAELVVTAGHARGERLRPHLGEGAVGLVRQPAGAVVGDAVGEATTVDQPVAGVVVVEVVVAGAAGVLLLDRLVEVRIDLGEQDEEVLVVVGTVGVELAAGAEFAVVVKRLFVLL